MPYYLTPIEETKELRMGRPVRRARLSDTPGASCICLDKTALLWLPAPVSDPMLTLLSSGKTDLPTTANKTAVQAALGNDRIISPTANLQDIVKDILLNPKAQKWGALQPSYQRQQMEIWLGPPEDKLFWSQKQHVPGASKRYSDNFNRGAANLNGSAFSDGSGVTWVEVLTTWTGANNRAEANNIPNDTFPAAITNTDLDTDNTFAQAELVLFTRAASTYLQGGPTAKCANNGVSGYWFGVGYNSSNVGYRFVARISTQVDVVYDSNVTTSGILKIVVDGSSISGLVNGSVVLGPVTDTTEPSGAGNRRCGLLVYGSGSTNDIAFDDFTCQDLSFGLAVISGTAIASITEADIVTGGKTIIITLDGTTWVGA